jgi:hypothetical protein
MSDLKQGPQDFDFWLILKLKFGKLKWRTLKKEVFFFMN